MTVFAFQADLFLSVTLGTCNAQTLGVRQQNIVPDNPDLRAAHQHKHHVTAVKLTTLSGSVLGGLLVLGLGASQAVSGAAWESSTWAESSPAFKSGVSF